MAIENPEDFLPNDPVQRKVLTDCVQEIVNSKIREQAEKTLQKEAAAAKAKECGMSSAKIRRFAAWKFKGDLTKRVEELSAEEAQYSILFGNENALHTQAPMQVLNS